jgi:serine/threonine protein kinase/tetratricopeptide (TPR) repeat protein
MVGTTDKDRFIGTYRLVRVLGEDGMGVVHLARHVASEASVALKTVQDSAPRWLNHIRHEIQVLSQLEGHPGIVRILDHGVSDGRPWYAMDLLEGEHLSDFIVRLWSPYRPSPLPRGHTARLDKTEVLTGNAPDREEAPPALEPPSAERPVVAAGQLPKVLEIVRDICTALAFLHGEGFVHRDLKPGNIMLVQGHPVIFDLGLAAHHPGASGREEMASQDDLGTVPYMSPEQIRGEFVDARSDLYSLGCILYELVARRPPFIHAIQHLTSPPVPPSELVDDLPPALEAVILKLLEKRVSERYGYADELSAVLATMDGQAQPRDHGPPARPYLYRPTFVGREELLARLTTLRDGAAEGSGAFAMLSGESGVGKTRVAMELTRRSGGAPMQVVTSEAVSLSVLRLGSAGAAPLQAIRPLLRAIADRCHELGPEATERFLGHRRSVLAAYEPLVAQTPMIASVPPPSLLGPAASRRRLIDYLTEVLAAFALEKPLLWVIDDLGWADELSLAFLQSLSARFFETTPVFIIATYRSEEANAAVRALAGHDHVTHVTLARLGRDAVRTIVSSMLALAKSWPGFVEFVASQAEGNPFFVAEYLRAAVTNGLLYRGPEHTWQLRGNVHSLGLPGSLRELIDHRLGALSRSAQSVGASAAVLGRDVEAEDLSAVAGLTDEGLGVAVDELVLRQVFEEAHGGQLRFAHDKLREVFYERLSEDERAAMHGRAGFALERRHKDAPDADRHWAAIGYHFATARLAKPAANYLRRAAEHARATYANADAIRLYGEATEQLERLLLQGEEATEAVPAMLAELCEARGDLQTLVAQREDARRSYDRVLAQTAADQVAARARVLRKIGKTWELEHDHEKALRFYEEAERMLPADPTPALPEERDEWIQVRIEKQWLQYWRNDLAALDVVVSTLAPHVAAFGAPLQRVRFYGSIVLRNHRRDRFVSSEETVNFARAAVAACPPSALLTEGPMAHFVLGFALLFRGAIPEAEQELSTSLRLARRAGDTALQARCWTYMCVASRMQGRVEEVVVRAAEIAACAASAGLREYTAAAVAQRAWLRANDGEHTDAARLAEEALAIWRSLPLVFPFRWMALIPLLHASLELGDLARAVQAADGLVDRSQQALPGPATDALRRASHFYHARAESDAALQLKTALARLREHQLR